MMMRIDSELHLVMPIREDEAGQPSGWAYHTPIGLPVFDANYRVLASTKAKLFAQGARYAFEAGPLVASRHLIDEGRRDALDSRQTGADGQPDDGGASALLAEIRRLTMVAFPGASGWEAVPVDVAMQRNDLHPEDWREAESRLVFFTCIYWLTARQKRHRIVSEVASVIEGSIISSPITEWIASLPKSTMGGSLPGAV